MGESSAQEPHEQESERQEQHHVEQQLQDRGDTTRGDVLDECQRVELRGQVMCGAVAVGVVRHRILGERHQAGDIQYTQVGSDDGSQTQPMVAMVEQRENRQGQERRDERPSHQRDQQGSAESLRIQGYDTHRSPH